MSLYLYPGSLVLNTEALWRICQEAIYYLKKQSFSYKAYQSELWRELSKLSKENDIYCYGKIFDSVHFAS